MLEIQNNGIAIFDNAFSDKFCDQLIEHFTWSQENNMSWNRQDSENTDEIYKNDSSVALQNKCSERCFSSDHTNLISKFNSIFFDTWYKEYTNFFSTLNSAATHGIYTYKIQKTMPGQGYHVWHFESGNMVTSRRLGAYILYLNTVDDGGETEFLYLRQRVKPVKGRLLIFPAGYVFTHRGNPPLSNDKYIMTGWLEYMNG
jgi:hypothetical protein